MRLTALCAARTAAALSLAGSCSCRAADESLAPRPSQLRVLRLFEPAAGSQALGTNLRDAVLLLPAVLAPAERRLLICEADRLLAAPKGYSRDRYDTDDEGQDDSDSDSGRDGCGDGAQTEEEEGGGPVGGAFALRRVSLCDMCADARGISERLLQERVLPALRAELPALSTAVLGMAETAAPGAGQVKLELEYASDEPSVNVYTPGGAFEAHEDGYALTVIVLLSEDGAFAGGGTAFWPGDGSAADARVHVSPPAGAALMFDGDLKHAGAPVVSGTRHLYVASFNVVTAQSEWSP